jgi:hypothetical protein
MRVTRSTLIAAASTLLLVGCATIYEPVPPNYTGPKARLSDSWGEVTSTKAEMFVVQEVDGNPVVNAIQITRQASRNQGFSLIVEGHGRDIPIKPLQLKLRGTHITGAPIHEIAARAAGTFHSVEGVVQFTPEAGRRYYINGKLSSAESAVWVEDREAKQPVPGTVITNRAK